MFPSSLCLMLHQHAKHIFAINGRTQSVRPRGDLWGRSGMDGKVSEWDLSNGFSVKDKPQDAFVFY